MFTHNFDPVLIDFGLLTIRWYSLAYIFGILLGWWYGKKIIVKRFELENSKDELKEFDNLITYIIISIIIGGRIGYVIFYNLKYYLNNPIDIIKIWEGGMSFHGALIGIIIGTYLFSSRKNIQTLFFLDIIACVSPIGIFLGRIANFINGELIGKITSVPWSVIFPNIDMQPRQNYIYGTCSFVFLIGYGIVRIISEFFREPDVQIGYFLNIFSMGTILSFIMIIAGVFMLNNLKRKNEI